ncbi:MAG: hypothetical protein LV471_01900 [Nitrosomonas sp.]|nr:hypothetical protein [Nitrosomonas sp.]
MISLKKLIFDATIARQNPDLFICYPVSQREKPPMPNFGVRSSKATTQHKELKSDTQVTASG